MNISVIQEIVYTYLSEHFNQSFKAKELAKKLAITKSDYTQFKALLKAMVKDGRIYRYKRGRYGLGDKITEVIGKLHVKTMGYGFVNRDEGEDIFISQKNMGIALHDDIVRVRMFAHSNGKRPEGKIVDIIERGNSNIVGVYRKGRKHSFVVPDELKIQRDIYISDEDSMGARNGQKVVVQIEYWEHENLNPTGKIVRILGAIGDPGVDISAIAAFYNLDKEFPPGIEQEIQAITGELPPGVIKQRQDLRHLECFTIDPPGAKDFDDAVSLEQLPGNKWRLGVHIADVSYFVQENSIIDLEARDRGTSVYLVDRVIPMLPHKLSNELCSLQPGRDRLTFSVLMDITANGTVLAYEIVESIINSHCRFTYEQVQDIIDGKVDSPFRETLLDMFKLSQQLIKKRQQRGAVDIDSLEVKVVLNELGHPIALTREIRLDSHRLIEEFMLLANVTIARHVGKVLQEQYQQSLPFIYRIHEKPDREKMAEFLRLLSAFGYQVAAPKRVTSRFFQKIVTRVKDSDASVIIENALLRAMMKAAYSTENIGHFALLYQYYTHFTSPIRRYPDLMVHRLLKKYRDPKGMELPVVPLAQICKHASEREIIAQEAERESIKAKQVLFMADRIGQVFDGIISRVTNFGLFVELPEQLVSGMVHVTELNEDYYTYDENRFALIGERTRTVFRLGDKLKVQLKKVDLDRRLIDFTVVEKPKRKGKKKN